VLGIGRLLCSDNLANGCSLVFMRLVLLVVNLKYFVYKSKPSIGLFILPKSLVAMCVYTSVVLLLWCLYSNLYKQCTKSLGNGMLASSLFAMCILV
jgi:hypothetical protein